MKKTSSKKRKDELRREYDLEQLGKGVCGKYFRQASSGTNLVLIEPELAKVFSTTGQVNNALRLLVDTAQAAAPARGRRSATKRLKRTG